MLVEPGRGLSARLLQSVNFRPVEWKGHDAAE
jgi:hypothetical protein